VSEAPRLPRQHLAPIPRLFIAAKIWRHAGCRTGVSYSDHYEEQTTFQRLMSRLRTIVLRSSGFKPVIVAPPMLNPSSAVHRFMHSSQVQRQTGRTENEPRIDGLSFAKIP